MVKRPRRQPGRPTLRDEPSQAPQEASTATRGTNAFQNANASPKTKKAHQWILNDKFYQKTKKHISEFYKWQILSKAKKGISILCEYYVIIYKLTRKE